MKRYISVAVCVALCGCWPFVTMHSDIQTTSVPHVQGTWTGVTEAVTLYDPSGKPHGAVAVRIDSGPHMKTSDGSDYPLPTDANPVLIGETGQVLAPPVVSLGHRVEVAGIMMHRLPVYLPDGSPSTQPNSQVFGIIVEGTPKAIP